MPSGSTTTLIGKGANGTNAVLLVMPEVQQPLRLATGPNTNEFGKLPNGMYMNTVMYDDMAAPRRDHGPDAHAGRWT